MRGPPIPVKGRVVLMARAVALRARPDPVGISTARESPPRPDHAQEAVWPTGIRTPRRGLGSLGGHLPQPTEAQLLRGTLLPLQRVVLFQTAPTPMLSEMDPSQLLPVPPCRINLLRLRRSAVPIKRNGLRLCSKQLRNTEGCLRTCRAPCSSRCLDCGISAACSRRRMPARVQGSHVCGLTCPPLHLPALQA